MSSYVARDVLTVARVTDDGQSFEDLGIMERKAGQLIIKCQSYEQVPPSQEALMRRIDELCQENERLRQEKPRTMLSVTARHVAELQAENAKLRKMNEAMWLIIRCAIGEVSARDGLPVIHEDDLIMLRNMRRDLRNEVDE